MLENGGNAGLHHIPLLLYFELRCTCPPARGLGTPGRGFPLLRSGVSGNTQTVPFKVVTITWRMCCWCSNTAAFVFAGILKICLKFYTKVKQRIKVGILPQFVLQRYWPPRKLIVHEPWFRRGGAFSFGCTFSLPNLSDFFSSLRCESTGRQTGRLRSTTSDRSCMPPYEVACVGCSLWLFFFC